jgi:hypothetical protein
VDFPNPFQTEDTRPKSPGEQAQYWASLAAMGLQFFGVSLLVHEHQALATLINAILRSYPRLREIGIDQGTKEEHKD